MSHATPHAVQWVAVSVGVSQPLMSGGALSQSAQPLAQPAYLHAVPSQVAAVLWVVSQAAPQAPQFEVEWVSVSQPSESGAFVLQSARPGAQPV